MAGKVENRIFVGGLSWETTERHLEDAFDCYGKILESQIMLERDTGRPRGFGFVTFADQRGMEDAIREMHGQELGGRVISVNKAQPKMGVDDTGFGYGGGYSSGSQSSYGVGDRPVGRSDCFKCGRPGHWARECPTGNGISSGGSRFSAPRRFVGGGGRGDGFGGGRYGDRYDDDRYNGARYADRDRLDRRDSRYGGNDRYDRYPAGGDRFGGDRYGGSGQRPQSGYSKDRGYGRGGGVRRGRDRYGSGGPARYEGGSFRDRPGPYDRPPPNRGGRPPSFEPY